MTIQTMTLDQLHAAVKLGNAGAAERLYREFQEMGDLAPQGIDTIRAERYGELYLALDKHGDALKLPNLDRVVPLPPAKLPFWDSKQDSLIKFAQIIIPQQAKPQLTGREHIPEGYVIESTDYSTVPGQAINTTCLKDGYWEGCVPGISVTKPTYFRCGESFSKPPSLDSWSIQHFRWYYCGKAVPDPEYKKNLIEIGVARGREVVYPMQKCNAGTVCPHSGIWIALVPDKHPNNKAFNLWRRQAYLEQGQTMPGANYWIGEDTLALISNRDITWHLIEPWQGGHGAWIGEKPE